jgi:plastocyanin
MVRKSATAFFLVLVGLLAGSAASRSQPQSQPQPVIIKVTMVDYKFIPDHLMLQHDVHYRLHLENRGKETHELTAPTFFATAAIDNPETLNKDRTEIVVQPGQTKDVLLTAHKPGTYDLRCSDHDWAGMVGGITVK